MAKGNFEMKGMKEFMRELNSEIRKLKGRTHRGLIEAAIELWREAEPGTPIDTSNLNHSFFIVSFKTDGNQAPGATKSGEFKGEDAGKLKGDHAKVIQVASGAAKDLGSDTEPIVIFGYSANYAVFVHENVDATFSRPGAKARWLYAAMQKARGNMLKKIQQHAKF